MYVAVPTVTVTERLAVAPASMARSKVAVPVTVMPDAALVMTVLVRAAWPPKVPLRSFWEPNEVVPAMRSISDRSCSISFCAAWRAAESDDAVLAAWTMRSRTRLSIEWTSFRAPSAVWTTLTPSWALRVAWRRPLTWARRPWLMTSPDASSAALLMRYPEDSFSRLFDNMVFVVAKLR